MRRVAVSPQHCVFVQSSCAGTLSPPKIADRISFGVRAHEGCADNVSVLGGIALHDSLSLFVVSPVRCVLSIQHTDEETSGVVVFVGRPRKPCAGGFPTDVCSRAFVFLNSSTLDRCWLEQNDVLASFFLREILSDPVLRRCGSGVAVLDFADVFAPSMVFGRGVCFFGARQTVPRSEVHTGIQALPFVPRKTLLVLISD